MSVDTSGLEPFLPNGSIQARATALTSRVLYKADAAILLLDAREGVVPADEALASWLRSTSANMVEKVILVANKCEGRGTDVGAVVVDSLKLGFGEPVAISAETGEGMADLFQALRPRLDPIIESRKALVEELADKEGGDEDAEGQSQHKGPVKVAIMGLTNVVSIFMSFVRLLLRLIKTQILQGKSTLTNFLVQEERCLTGPEPGLTRDAIKVKLRVEEQDIELVDTAGWIRRARLSSHDDSGGEVAARTLEEGRTVLRFVHVVILVVDVLRILERNEGLTHQEATLAADVAREGRNLVIAANKLDELSPDHAERALDLIQSAAEGALADVRGVPILGISALTGVGADSLLPTALDLYNIWNKRVPTSKLNRWVEGAAAARPVGGGKDLRRIKYLSQVKARPPTFVAFVSGGSKLEESTRRYLVNLIREEFGFHSVPVRVTVRRKEKYKNRK